MLKSYVENELQNVFGICTSDTVLHVIYIWTQIQSLITPVISEEIRAQKYGLTSRVTDNM